jgi:hypothetical protein
MFIPYTKAQHIDESSCMFIAGRDGRTANAEHWRQQRQHIYFVYVSSHAPCPWFGMSAMFRAMAAEVRWVLISTSIFQGCLGPKFVSQALDLLFRCGFLRATWVGLCLGVLNPAFQLLRVGIWSLSLYLTSRYEFVLWGGWISMYRAVSQVEVQIRISLKDNIVLQSDCFSKISRVFFASRNLWIIVVFLQYMPKENIPFVLINTLLLHILIALTCPQTEWWTEKQIHSLRMGCRNFFSSCGFVSVFGSGGK